MDKKELLKSVYRNEVKYDNIKRRIKAYSNPKSKARKKDLVKGLPKNYNTAFEWLNALEADSLTNSRRVKYAYGIRRLIELAGNAQFKEMKRGDVETLCKTINEVFPKANTRFDLRVALKKFFKWLRQTDEYPDEVRWIKAKRGKNGITNNDLLTDDEVKRIIGAETNIMFKALFAMAGASGCRISELLSIRYCDVKDEGDLITIDVDGKTGQRVVPLTEYLEPIRAWIKQYPLTDNQPFFYTERTGKVTGFAYSAVAKHLRKAVKRAGVTKRVYFHLFRHTATSKLAPHMKEAMIKQRMGWTRSSDQLDNYLHLDKTEVINAQREYHTALFGDDRTKEQLEREVADLLLDANDAEKLMKKALKNRVKASKLKGLLKQLAKHQ